MPRPDIVRVLVWFWGVGEGDGRRMENASCEGRRWARSAQIGVLWRSPDSATHTPSRELSCVLIGAKPGAEKLRPKTNAALSCSLIGSGASSLAHWPNSACATAPLLERARRPSPPHNSHFLFHLSRHPPPPKPNHFPTQWLPRLLLRSPPRRSPRAAPRSASRPSTRRTRSTSTRS